MLNNNDELFYALSYQLYQTKHQHLCDSLNSLKANDNTQLDSKFESDSKKSDIE